LVSNLTPESKSIYRRDAKSAKKVKNKVLFIFKGFLGALGVLAVNAL
jgi:hypothetical protein